MKKHFTLFILMVLATITGYSQTKQEIDSIYELGRNVNNELSTAKARSYCQQAMNAYEKLYGKVSDDYINALNAYAASFGQEADFKKAAEQEQQVLNLCEKLGHEHPRIGLFYENMGYYSYMANDYKNGTKYWELALPFEEKYSKKYEVMLQGLGMMYEALEDYDGMSHIMKLMEDHNQHELSLPCEELECMIERAEYFVSVGDNTSAKEWYLKAVATVRDDDEKITVYEAYSRFISMTMNDFVSGAEYQMAAANLRKTLKGEDDDYFNSLNKAGIYSYLGKQFQQAVDCYLPILAHYQQSNTSAAKSNVAKCQKNLGNAYVGLRDYLKAKECFKQSLAYYEKHDKKSDEYPQAIARLASAEKFNKDYEDAIEHYKQAMKIFEERNMMQDYSNAASSLSLCYTYAGIEEEVDFKEDAVKAEMYKQIDESIKELKDNLQITKDYLGQLVYAQTLGTIAGSYSQKEDYANAIEYYKLYMPAIRDGIRIEFQLQSEAERMATWKEENYNIQGLKELLVMIPEGNQQWTGDIAALVYDAALLSKGILLNSSIEFEKVLAEKGNDNLKGIYEQIKANLAQLEYLREHAVSDADLENILRLTEENKSLQLQLYKSCKELSDFTDYISYDWKAVQQTLQPTDVAIEFVSINPVVSNADDIMVAIVLTKEMKTPVAVTIWNNENLMRCDETEACQQIQSDIISHVINQNCDINYLKGLLLSPELQTSPYKCEISLYLQCMISEKEANADYLPMPMLGLMKYSKILDNNTLYDSPDAGELIWGSMNQYLDGKQRIFFSADGCFNHIGIEYLKYNGKPLSEQYEVYRLSSTKELCYHHQKPEIEKIALFGGINYNREATMSETTETELLALREKNGVFGSLPATKREVNGIEAVMKNNQSMTITKLTETEASQAAFLGLDGSKVNLIHIATHGVYTETQRATDNESMDNSILAFAGANMFKDTHDGIVSASDIAKMNLRECDLAVLSACETGLGKLGDDGVFGLQRGFKNAGVHTLLMSIKKVYDVSTADLMTNFYRNMSEGFSKREALVKAQREIRENGYKDAKYWATFILLDAID